MIFRLLLLLLLASPAMGQKEKTYAQKIPGTTQTFTMVAIPAGKFTLGSKSILADNDEGPPVEIELSAFWIGEHEVTFAEWDAFFKDASVPQAKNMDGVTRATPQYIDLTWGMGREPNHPANSMTQQAALMYCRWLYSKTGIFFRLPTEAEWEYACKAGETKLPDPATLGEFGWFTGNSSGRFQLVMQKKANAWGLYDMLGNLSEWTLDQYDPVGYASLSKKDPMVTPATRYPKAVRGGSFEDAANQLRCTNRIASDPAWNQRDPQIPKSRWWMTDAMFVGFRVVRPARQPPAEEIEQFFARYLK
ncbi:MAG: SUMF1/EgtB/PvdO family nonheme iron enzyme [Cyclobacteriaceae bacterium]|nr:SUMF1/EgtB/PvdO family nonheme iron enzyme [Cyclobacteriaceae bacterium]